MNAPPSAARPVPRSVLSRIIAPLEAKATNITRFAITLKEPHRCYAPSDKVSGSVSFCVTKPVRITHLVIDLTASVKVFKKNVGSDESLSRKELFHGVGRGVMEPEYFGDGFATIFQHESVLCGDATLPRQHYVYRFEIAFPSKSLPSSISFERGKVYYQLIATLTRPTSVLPTLSCNYRINFRDSIDIATLRPQHRAIALEPVIGRPRSRSQATNATPRTDLRAIGANTDEPGELSSPVRQALQVAQEGSMACTTLNEPDSPATTSSRTSQGISTQKGLSSRPDKAIRIQVDLLRGGCLPGGEATVRVSVKHVRAVRSLHGVIITLHRMSHVDREPSTPIKASDRTKLGLDAVPKSRSGLSGLVFSSEDPNMTFRANLAQNTTHLIVDPETLSATVTQSVRVPEEVFPTIMNVPGNLLAFKYYVEVIVDVQAKLASQNSYFSWYVQANGSFDTPKNTVAFDYQHTSVFRRETCVVACDMPLIIGTKDSTPKLLRQPAIFSASHVSTVHPGISQSQGTRLDRRALLRHRNQEISDITQMASTPGGDTHDKNIQRSMDQQIRPDTQLQLSLRVEDSLIDEKTRLRRAAELLLPSAPPMDEDHGDVGSSSLRLPEPSAPTEIEIRSGAGVTVLTPTAEITPMSTIYRDSTRQSISAERRETPSATNRTQVDKQELERQSLMAMVGAPELESDEEAGRRVDVPSAPILEDAGVEQTFYGHSDRIDELPLYQE
ncbi:ph-response sensor protein [Xylographa opegraphella]|nr:ph-response sensor protein [Xylographa opegraphella]